MGSEMCRTGSSTSVGTRSNDDLDTTVVRRLCVAAVIAATLLYVPSATAQVEPAAPSPRQLSLENKPWKGDFEAMKGAKGATGRAETQTADWMMALGATMP
jgi:hypothetical protein